jgi:hypothetical protein
MHGQRWVRLRVADDVLDRAFCAYPMPASLEARLHVAGQTGDVFRPVQPAKIFVDETEKVVAEIETLRVSKRVLEEAGRAGAEQSSSSTRCGRSAPLKPLIGTARGAFGEEHGQSSDGPLGLKLPCGCAQKMGAGFGGLRAPFAVEKSSDDKMVVRGPQFARVGANGRADRGVEQGLGGRGRGEQGVTCADGGLGSTESPEDLTDTERCEPLGLAEEDVGERAANVQENAWTSWSARGRGRRRVSGSR